MFKYAYSVTPSASSESNHFDKGKNETGCDMFKCLVFQGSTEIIAETSWVCDFKMSRSRAECFSGSPCLPHTQTVQVMISLGARQCALRDIPSLSEVILLCKELLGLASLKGVKLDCAIKI